MLSKMLIDVTLREGSQQPKELGKATIEQKMAILKAQCEIGLAGIEVTAFAPGSWYHDADELANLSKNIDTNNTELIGLYFNLKGAERLFAYPHFKKLGIFHTALTNNYRAKNYNQPDLNNVNLRVEQLRSWLENNGAKLSTLVISTAFGEKAEPLSKEAASLKIIEMLQLVDKQNSLTQVTLADTEGLATPETLSFVVKQVASYFPDLKIIAHLHPHLDQTEDLVNSGIESGIDGWEGAWLGLGGSPFADNPNGNLDIQTIIKVFKSRGLELGIDIHNVDILLDKLQEVLKLSYFSN